MQPSSATIQPTRSSRSGGATRESSGDIHRRVVRDQFVQLHDVFNQSRPSESLRDIFDQSVAAEIRRRLADDAGPLRILEVGCGVGNWAEIVYSTFESDAARINYLGIDFAERCVESCNARLAGRTNARACVSDFELLSPTAPYDLLFFVEVFCHLRRRQDEAWLAHAKSFLRPGGSMLVIDKERYSKHGWKVRWDLFKRRTLPAAWRGRPYYFPETYNRLLTTLRYPSFRHLAGELKGLSLHTRPVIRHGLFSALAADRPAL